MLHDFRFALRQLLKARGFTIAAVTVLAFGIGANTAIFSLLDTMLFQPPAFAKPTEIVQLFSQDKKEPKTFRGFSYPTYLDVRDQNTVFADTMAHNLALVGIGDKSDTRRTFADIVTANYFSVLGVRPIQGRAFLPEEEKPGSNAAVAIVSYSYWQKQGLNPALLGSSMTINSRPFTIVGILPKGFSGTMQVFSPEIWVPLGVHDQVVNDFQTESHKRARRSRRARNLLVIARLKPGLTAAAATPALKTLAANLEQAYPVEQKNQTFMTEPLSRFRHQHEPLGRRRSESARAAPLRHGGRGPARGLLESRQHVARPRHGAAEGNRHPSRPGREPLADRAPAADRRLRARRRSASAFGLLLGLWSSDLLVASMGNMMPVDMVWRGGLNASVLLATFVFCVLGTLAFALGPALEVVARRGGRRLEGTGRRRCR